jgi:hypothetical protein
LSDPDAKVVFVGRRDCLAGFGVKRLGAEVCAQSRRFVVADRGETTGVFVRAMFEVFPSRWTRVCGCGGARDRVMRVLVAADSELGGTA